MMKRKKRKNTMIENIMAFLYKHNSYFSGLILGLNFGAFTNQLAKEEYGWALIYLVICFAIHISYLDTKNEKA